ncbi:hypothetical protein R1sor_015810 [Riccia sorocarpa]|uniref:PGG domain-containing protein n=1 Tax=Riccia sorocarpa TaxID=122646 RepID=A0ABD3HHF4_9MARC
MRVAKLVTEMKVTEDVQNAAAYPVEGSYTRFYNWSSISEMNSDWDMCSVTGILYSVKALRPIIDKLPKPRHESNLPEDRAISSLKGMIEIARDVIGVSKVDLMGAEIANTTRQLTSAWDLWDRSSTEDWPKWSWHLATSDNSVELKEAMCKVFAYLPITDEDLTLLKQGMSWATAVMNEDFLQMYFGIDGLQVRLMQLMMSRPEESRKDVLELRKEVHKFLTGAGGDDNPISSDGNLVPSCKRTLRSPSTLSTLLESELNRERENIWRLVSWKQEKGRENQFLLSRLLWQEARRFLELLFAPGKPFCIKYSECTNGDGAPTLPTLLHYACLYSADNSAPVISEIFKSTLLSADRKRELLEYASPCHGLRPLHIAVIGGNRMAVKVLLEHHRVLDINSNINSVDCGQRTPLHWAVYSRDAEMVKLLVNHCITANQSLNALDEDSDFNCPMETAIMWDESGKWNSAGNAAVADHLMRAPEVERQIDREYRDRQVFVDAANAILVGAALIASVTFAGWLQPPLGYVEYSQYPVGNSNSGNFNSFAAIEQELLIKIFWVFNSFSFFFAVGTVVAGSGAVLPRRYFIRRAVRGLNRWLMLTCMMLTVSIACGLGAFTAAGLVVLPPRFAFELYMIVPAIVGIMACTSIIAVYISRLWSSWEHLWKNNFFLTGWRKPTSPYCTREVVQGYIALAHMELQTLELLRRILSLEQFEYMHSVAIQIQRELNMSLADVTPELQRRCSDLVVTKLRSCKGNAKDGFQEFIEVRGRELCFSAMAPPDLQKEKVVEYLKDQRKGRKKEIRSVLDFCKHESENPQVQIAEVLAGIRKIMQTD